MEDLVSGLALHWQLRCTIEEGCTTHTKYVSDHARGIRRMPIQERWERDDQKLGQGNFGVVWRERCTSGPSSGKSRAVKQIFKNFGPLSISSKALSAELSAIMRFSDEAYRDYFVRSYGWYDTKDFLYITMEYLPLGDLSRYLKDPLPEAQAARISLQILEGLRFMHQNNFAHRDLKPNNLLVQQAGPSWWVKISDFGTSKRMDTTTLCSNVGTVAYQSPEVRGIVRLDDASRGNQLLSPFVDIWAVGAIAFRLATGRVPFEDVLSLCRYVDQGDPLPSGDGISEGSNAFVARLMAPMPHDRPTASQALADPWLSVSASELDVTHTDHAMTALVTEPYSTPDLTEDASAEWPPTELGTETPHFSANSPRDLSHGAPNGQDRPTSRSSDTQRVSRNYQQSNTETDNNNSHHMDDRNYNTPRHGSKPLASPKKRQSPPEAEYHGSGGSKSQVPKSPIIKARQKLLFNRHILHGFEYSDDGRTLFLVTPFYIHPYHSTGEVQWDKGKVFHKQNEGLKWQRWERRRTIGIKETNLSCFTIAGGKPVLFARDTKEGTNHVLIYTTNGRGGKYQPSTFTFPFQEGTIASTISRSGNLLILSSSHELQLWNLASQSLQQRIEVTYKTLALAVSTDGTRFAQIIKRPSASESGINEEAVGYFSYIWEYGESTDGFVNRNHFEGVVRKVLDDGSFFLSRGERLFLRRGSTETDLLAFSTPDHYSYCFSRDAQKLAIAHWNSEEECGGVTVWCRDGDGFSRSQKLLYRDIRDYGCYSFSPSGQQLTVADRRYKGNVYIWDL